MQVVIEIFRKDVEKKTKTPSHLKLYLQAKQSWLSIKVCHTLLSLAVIGEVLKQWSNYCHEEGQRGRRPLNGRAGGLLRYSLAVFWMQYSLTRNM